MKWRGRDGSAIEAGDGPDRGFARRALLRGLATGGAVAAVAAGGAASAEQEPEARSDDPTRLDYSETEHVRWFYRRARM